MIQIHDKTFEVFLTNEEIQNEIRSLAGRINADYAGKEVVFVAVLNGAFMFAADLMKHVVLPAEIAFVKVSSYQGMNSTGRVDEVIGVTQPLKNKHVVILEDIVDTGNTVEELKAIFKEKKVKHLKIATLFFKPEAYKKEIKIDYVGIRIPNKFIVGYGLDYDGLGRNLPDVYQLAQ